jgi:hypothetical protein
MAAVAACLFGLIPALAATRLDVHSALQAGRAAVTGTRARIGRALIAAQIAIALVMLSCALLFTQSLWNLRHQDFGFDAAHVIAADIPLEFTRGMRERHTALRGPLFDAANALPGVRSAATSGFGILGSMQHTVNASTPIACIPAGAACSERPLVIRATAKRLWQPRRFSQEMVSFSGTQNSADPRAANWNSRGSTPTMV